MTNCCVPITMASLSFRLTLQGRQLLQPRQELMAMVSSVKQFSTPVAAIVPKRLEELRKRLKEDKQSDNSTISPVLTDKFARKHNYLRISVSERCNLRCTYCMPEEGVPLTPSAKLLSADEITKVAKIFVTQGVNKVRITGGEPLLRKDLKMIVKNIAGMNVESIGITTNGILLTRLLPDLVEAGLTHVNISLDSLNPIKFERISRRPSATWQKVWRGLQLAIDIMPRQVKLNCVVMKGTNDDEICDFVRLTKDMNVDVRFIEYMPFTGNKWDLTNMLSYVDMMKKVLHEFPHIEKLEDSVHHTSKAYKVPGHTGQVGFITSMSEHFCGGCNRLRITADGNLKVCLFGNAEVSLRDAIRKGASEEELLELIGQAVSRKHAKHAGMLNLAKMENRPMILIDDLPSRRSFPSFIKLNNKDMKSLPFLASSSSHYITRRLCTSKTSQKALSHVDSQGKVQMVDVSSKVPTEREAIAEVFVKLSTEAFQAVVDNKMKKGDVLSVAQVAGIMGAKQTSNLIPLCHPLPLSKVDVQLELIPEERSIRILTRAKTTSTTGVEMEALMAASVAALTIYDMCKAVDHKILVTNLRLLRKTGGKSDYKVDNN